MQRDGIDLDDHAVDIVGQLRPACFPGVAEIDHLADRVEPLGFPVGRKPLAGQPVQPLEMAVQFGLLRDRAVFIFETHRVEEYPQGPLGDDAGVVELQRARRGVAGVREERLFPLRPQFVQFLEPVVGEIHLAPHLDVVEPGPFLGHAQGDGPDGAQVRRDVVALFAVSPRGAQGQRAVFIAQADGHAVYLQFDRVGVFPFRAQQVAGPAVEVPDLLVVVRVADGEHGHGVPDDGEGRGRRTPDALCGRIGGYQTGVGRFQVPQLVHQHVVLVIADDRVGEYEIPVIVRPDFPAQDVYAFGRRHGFRGPG